MRGVVWGMLAIMPFVETTTDLCRRVCIANTPASVGNIDILRDYVKIILLTVLL